MDKQSCPLCGNTSEIVVFHSEPGVVYLRCSFCHHSWDEEVR